MTYVEDNHLEKSGYSTIYVWTPGTSEKSMIKKDMYNVKESEYKLDRS